MDPGEGELKGVVRRHVIDDVDYSGKVLMSGIPFYDGFEFGETRKNFLFLLVSLDSK